MTATRKRTVTALVGAILVLLASAGTAIAVVASSGDRPAAQGQGCASRYDADVAPGRSQPAGRDCEDWGWGGSMMGDVGSGFGWMMGPGQGWSESRSGGHWGDSRAYGLNGAGPVTATQAHQQAQRWVDRYAASARLGNQVAMPMGYRFLATQDGTVVAMIMVDDDTGTVLGHLRAPAVPR